MANSDTSWCEGNCNITNFLSYLFVTFYDGRKEKIIMLTRSLIRKMQHSATFLAEQKIKWGVWQRTGNVSFLQARSLILIGFSIVLFNINPVCLFAFNFREFLVHCSHSAPHWDNLEGHYVFMHREQIMLLQAIASLISIKESDKKEQKTKTPWENIGRISLLLWITESRTWHKEKTSNLEVET